ncbi:MAG: glycosyltransferase family 2 protein [Bacteroidota bacterium]
MTVPVTVVILNWNGRHWLEKFLPSVTASTYSHLHILVVDNASTDDSVDFVRKKYPQIQVEVMEENHGFAEGNNRALAFIDTPYFILLNSDVEVTPQWLEPLIARMEAQPEIAALQPKIRAHFDKTSFEYAGASGGWMDRFAYPFCRGRIFDTLEKDHGQYESPEEIFWATGACCCIRTEVVQKIGLFQPEFFAHMEEIDFCWRAKNFGYQIWVEPTSVVYHVGGGALPKENPRKTFLNVRNSLACMYLNLPAGQRFPKVFFRLILDGVWGIKALLSWDWGTIKAILKAHFAFYGQLGTWNRRRKETYAEQKPSRPQAGYFPKSIVWQYFVRGKKRFSELKAPGKPA